MEVTAVGERSVDRDGSRWSVTAEPGGGIVTYTITADGSTAQIAVDVSTAKEIRLLEAAAIATAQNAPLEP